MALSSSAHRDTCCRDHLPATALWPRFEFIRPELGYPQRLNATTALLDDMVAALGPDRPCLICQTARWSYGELLCRANQIAHVLTEDLGLVPGQRVLLRGPNNPYLVTCWFGVLKAGGVLVTTMPLLRTGERHELLEFTTPAFAFCDHRYAAELAVAVASEPEGLTTLHYDGNGDEDLIIRAETKSAEFTNVETAADDVAMLAPTSGTTGTPKVSMHFHRDILAVADTFSRHVLDPCPKDVFTGTPPLAFTFGLGLLIFPMRGGGASVLLLERASPDELAAAVAEHGVTVLFTAPTAYRAMLRGGHHAVLAGLRRCVSAGEHLPASVWQDMLEQTGVRIIDGIGATEMMHVFISAADGDIRPGSTGRVVPGYRAAILDENGAPVPDGTPGRLAVIGPTGCRYLADDRQADYVQHGWNITGDTYIRDAEGYYWYQARNDDVIISAGYNIAGPEVEQALETHPDVAEAAVVSLPDPDRGSIVHAAVVLRAGVAASDEETTGLKNHVKQALAPYKYPRSIEFVGELPRSATGKLQRHKLREGRALAR